MELSERQQRIVSAGVTTLAVAVIVAGIGLLFWALVLFGRTFSNVFLPVAVAGVAAMVFRPYYDWLRARLRGHDAPALLALFLSALIPLGALAWFFGALLVGQLSELIASLPALWERVQAWAQQQWPAVVAFLEENPLGRKLREALAGQGEAIARGVQLVGGAALSAGASIVRAVTGALGWMVTPVYFAFLLMARGRPLEQLQDNLPFLKAETRKDVVFLVDQFVEILVSFFRGQLLIGLIQGVLYGLGFSLVGLKYGLLLGLLLGFLNIVPYLGSMVGLAVTLPLAWFQEGGGAATLGGVLLVIVIVQMIEGYLLTPRIMGDRTGLHPMVIMVAIFFWGSALGGIMGMILAIPLTAFLVVFWRLAKEKYIGELV
jgi:predicted PurR-regulated permease PerM